GRHGDPGRSASEKCQSSGALRFRSSESCPRKSRGSRSYVDGTSASFRSGGGMPARGAATRDARPVPNNAAPEHPDESLSVRGPDNGRFGPAKIDCDQLAQQGAQVACPRAAESRFELPLRFGPSFERYPEPLLARFG